jgi:hypothetical protein
MSIPRFTDGPVRLACSLNGVRGTHAMASPAARGDTAMTPRGHCQGNLAVT